MVADVVAGGIDADDRVAAAEHQAIDDGGGDAALIIGRVVRLQAHRHAPFEADRVAKAGDDLDLARGENKILIAHDLGDRRRDLRRDARSKARQNLRGRRLRQKPVAELADRHVRDGRKCALVVAVDDQPA